MLKRIQVRDFEGAADVDISLGPVTVLRGANGHGKTSVAEAIAFLLLGETLRGGVLADVIRFGRKTASIKITLPDGTEIGRTQTDKTATRTVGVGVVAAASFTGEVRRLVGDPRAIRSVLASGGLLSMSPADLQRFLVDVSGGKLDGDAISRAFAEDVRAAAAKHAIPLPTSLGDWKTAREKAEGLRLARSRDLDKAKAAVVSAPQPAAEETRKTANIEKAITTLQAQREAATKAEAASGADARARRDEKLKACELKVADIEAKLADAITAKSALTAPDTDVTDLTEHLKTARAIAANLEAEIAGLDRRIASLEHADEKTPSDDMLAAELPSLETKRERARGASTKANVAAETARVAHANAAKNAANIPAGGTCANACEHCTVANAGQMYAAAKEAVKRLKAEWTIATRGHEVAVKDEQVISLAWEQATNAKARADAAAELADLRTRRSGLHPENVRADEQRILARIEASKAYAAAGITVAGLTDALRAEREQLAKVEAYQFPEPPATKVADLDARIANERTALHAAKVRDEFAVLTASQDLAHATWREHDLVVKALGPDGAIKELVATVVGPFLDAANAALAMLAPEWQVAIDPDDFGFVVQQPGGTCRASLLSKGSRWRLTAVLQIAVAQLAKVPLVIFDGVEDLDEVGGDGLSALVESCVGDGIQVLLLEHLDHGWTDDEDVTVVEIENGIAKSAGA